MLCLHSNFQRLVVSASQEIGGTELHTHTHTQTHTCDDYRMPPGSAHWGIINKQMEIIWRIPKVCYAWVKPSVHIKLVILLKISKQWVSLLCHSSTIPSYPAEDRSSEDWRCQDRVAWDTKAGTATLEQSVLSLLTFGDHSGSLDTIAVYIHVK